MSEELLYTFDMGDKITNTDKVFINFLYAGDGSRQSGVDFVAQCLIPEFVLDSRYIVLNKVKVSPLQRFFLTKLPFSRFVIESIIRTFYGNNLFLNFNYFTPYRLFRGRGQDITIIHDLLWYDFEIEGSPFKQFWMKKQLKRTITRALFLVCVSEFTKSRIVAHFPQSSGKIKVVSNPVDSTRLLGGAEMTIPDIGSRFFLCISSNYPHKNISVVKNAFQNIVKNWDCKLVLVGPRLNKKSEQNPNTNEYGLVELGFVTNETLGKLLVNCEALISPSIYEGFGLTNFEALALGKKILASNIPTVPDHPNITKILDYRDAASWERSISMFLENIDTAHPPQIYVSDKFGPTAIKKCYDEIVFGRA